MLRRVKGHEAMRAIPIIMLSTSENPEDVAASYAGGANSYVATQGGFKALVEQVKAVRDYWFVVSALPAGSAQATA